MKKTVVIFLLLIYSFTSIGAIVRLHYCMDEIVGWRLWQGKENNKCSKCGMKEKKGGCCKDEHKLIKLTTHQHKNKIDPYLRFVNTPALVTLYVPSTFNAVELDNYIPASNAPPPIPKKRLYILNCLFLV